MRKTTSTNFENERKLEQFCNAHKTLKIVSGRWKLSLLFSLSDSKLSYQEFKNILPNITDRVLAYQLKQLESDALILKNKTKGKSQYSLSTRGQSLMAILYKMSKWGNIHLS
ncbi:helix-turn-helix domain-containing protein [Aquimarina sp. I32.4]|uniref:winged helix-turn-helix transcriptional regulator n=1 Tax=Aquimarina sp. I32.4 TaxID=2053903 RepID=UPI000CDEA143|nr:winged helix-turn-helix transcriptional regulator [Aquimarina sp. I32.4]